MDEHAVDVASAGGVLRFDVDRHRVLAPSRGSPPRFADSLMRPQDSNSSSSSMIRYQTDDEGVVSQPEYTLTKPSNGPNDRDHLTNHSVIVTFPITPRRGSGWQPLARRRASATNGAAARTCLLPNSASSQSAKNLPPPGPHRRRTAPPAPPRVRRHTRRASRVLQRPARGEHGAGPDASPLECSGAWLQATSATSRRTCSRRPASSRAGRRNRSAVPYRRPHVPRRRSPAARAPSPFRPVD